jgi:Helitron helicase-like domain at N-terminus
VRTTQREYYSYQFHVKSNDHGFNIVHHSGRLFQEYIVDAWAQIEQGRLRYIVDHQSEILHDLYRKVIDAAANGADLHQVGNPVILLSTFAGGPRQMWQLYQDAMAIVRARGKPDLFVTMTCNTQWPEITSALLPGQKPQDRPDLVSRVFRLKLKSLLHDIMDRNIFGVPVARVHVIEFQKRGLPHAHIVIILDKSDKHRTPQDIDCVVCAEIPDRNEQPELHDTVVSYMLHGPCGAAKPNASCMKDGKCTKGYPRSYNDSTLVNEDGYPLYRRRDNGITFVKVIKGRCYKFTNRDVVPYNPYLSRKYNCHINVEIVSSFAAIKYLYKYVYKGPDQACASLEQDIAEPADVHKPKQYIDTRYFSFHEAIYRIFGFTMHQHYPSVCRLSYHLPDEQDVEYDPEVETAAAVIQRGTNELSKLTAFFRACVAYPELTSDLLYPNLPN